MVPHQDGLVLRPDSGFHDFADEHGVVAFSHLTYYLAFPPGRRVQQQRATGFLAGLELLPADGVALPLVGLEEVERQVQLIFP